MGCVVKRVKRDKLGTRSNGVLTRKAESLDLMWKKNVDEISQ